MLSLRVISLLNAGDLDMFGNCSLLYVLMQDDLLTAREMRLPLNV